MGAAEFAMPAGDVELVASCEGDFHTVGVDDDAITGVELQGEVDESFAGENSEKATVTAEMRERAIGFQDDRSGVAGGGELHQAGVDIDDAVDRGGEGGLGEFLFDERIVQASERLPGGEKAVTLAGGDFFGDERVLNEHSQ